jgi:hypothetical protein
MSDKITDAIRAVVNFPKDTTDEAAWNEYVTYFQGLPPFNRKTVLTFVDTECLDNIPAATRDAAKMLQKRRELEHMNEIMLRAGR